MESNSEEGDLKDPALELAVSASESPVPQSDSALLNTGAIETDSTSQEQGVDVGKGWLRYWDAAESEHYYFHSGELRVTCSFVSLV